MDYFTQFDLILIHYNLNKMSDRMFFVLKMLLILSFPFYILGYTFKYLLLPIFHILLGLKIGGFIDTSWWLVFLPLIVGLISLLIKYIIDNIY